MLTPEWKDLAIQDELLELRELAHLVLQPEFAAFLALPPGTLSADRSAVVGRAGFLFINDGSNRWREQLAGSFGATPAVHEQMAGRIRECCKQIESLGIQFRTIVIPEKDVLYPEWSPNVPETGISASRTVHRLQKELGDGVLYPVDALREASQSIRTYYARNSHYNFFGGVIACNALLRSLGRPGLSLRDVPTEIRLLPDDLSVKWVPELRIRKRLLARIYSEEEVVRVANHAGRYHVFRNPAARLRQAVIIYGDSYSWNEDAGFARLLCLEYSEVHFWWKKTVDMEFVARIRPACVILQSAERFLVKGLV